jgi:hypothetical protein
MKVSYEPHDESYTMAKFVEDRQLYPGSRVPSANKSNHHYKAKLFAITEMHLPSFIFVIRVIFLW